MYEIKIKDEVIKRYNMDKKTEFYYVNLVKKGINDFIAEYMSLYLPSSALFDCFLNQSDKKNKLNIYIDLSQEKYGDKYGLYFAKRGYYPDAVYIFIDTIVTNIRKPSKNEIDIFKGTLVHELFHCYHRCYFDDNGQKYPHSVVKRDMFSKEAAVKESLASFYEYLYYTKYCKNIFHQNRLTSFWKKFSSYKSKINNCSYIPYEFYYSYALKILSYSNSIKYFKFIFNTSIVSIDTAFGLF